MLVACAANWVYYDRSISLRELALNATMLPSLFHTKPILGLYWTLAVELMFYFMCAGLFSLNAKLIADARASGLICCALAGACAIPILLNNNFGTHLPEQYLSLHFSALFLGNTLRIQLHNTKRAILACTLPTFLIASAIASGALQEHKSTLNTLGGNGFFHGDVLAIAIFVFALKVPCRWPSILTEAGLISYSMYLLHWPVTTLIALIPTVGANPALHVPSTVVITIILSWLTFNGIEHPFMNISKWLVKRLPSNSTARLAAQDSPS
jgi:peptidoglycan/LPS O-acetylase OafA/YrhL